jgi:hypothetical protein
MVDSAYTEDGALKRADAYAREYVHRTYVVVKVVARVVCNPQAATVVRVDQ